MTERNEMLASDKELRKMSIPRSECEHTVATGDLMCCYELN